MQWRVQWRWHSAPWWQRKKQQAHKALLPAHLLCFAPSLPQNMKTPRYLSTLSCLFLSSKAEVNHQAVLTDCCWCGAIKKVHSSSHGLPHFINFLPIISFFPHQPDILHALAHCLLEPVEFSRVVMYSPLTFFFISSWPVLFFPFFIIYHMHQLLNPL